MVPHSRSPLYRRCARPLGAALLLAAPMILAHAQDLSTPPPVSGEAAGAAASNGKAHAAAAPAGVVVLDKVIVTAEKQGRSLLDTATSTAVIDSRDLQSRGLDDSRDLLANLANVTYLGQGNAAPAVRGIDGTGPAQGVDAFFAGTRPRLNVTLDGRPASYNEIVFGNNSMWDVEQVELLRGPQSLLQGRNAIAGTLAIKTLDPGFDPEASARVLAGDGDRNQEAFAVSGPLFGDQVAGRLSADRQHSESSIAFRPFPGASHPRDRDLENIRAKLLIKPGALPDLTALLTFQHSDASAPQAETIARPFSANIPSTDQMPVFESRSNAGIADVRWQWTERLRLEGLLTATDLDVDRFAPANTGVAHIDNTEYVFEPRLVLDRGDSRLSGILGVYLFHADQDETIDYPTAERFRDRTRTQAIYAEATYALSDTLDLDVGARQERETHHRHGGDPALVSIDLDKTYDTFLPKFGLAWHPDKDWTWGFVASRGYNAGGGGVTFDRPIVAYAYNPEYVRNYEAYVRGNLTDALQLTGNVFYGDYRDMQLEFNISTTPGLYSYVIRNAKRAYNTGAEFGLRWQAARTLQLYGNLGLLRTRITDYPGSDVVGNQFASAPRLTSDIGVTWRSPRGFEFNANARYSTGYYSDIENNPIARVGSFWMANLKGGYRLGGAYFFVGVTNLFDHHDPLQIFAVSTTPTAYDSGTIAEPRRVYAGFQYDWR